MATDRLITISVTATYIGITTNVGNAYTAGSPPVGGYVVNTLYDVNFNVANTSTATLDGHAIYKNGAALTGAEITAGADILLRWNGTQFNFAGDGGGGGTSPLTTKGDLYTHSSSADVRLPVGVNGKPVIADSLQTVGLNYTVARTDLKYSCTDQDDYTTPGNSSISMVSIKTYFVTTGAGTGAAHSATVYPGFQGVVAASTGTTSTGWAAFSGAFYASSGSSGTITLGMGTTEVVHIFRTDTNLSNATDRYFLLFGAYSVPGLNLIDGFGVFYRDNSNSGKFSIIVHVAGVQQTLAGGSTTVLADNAYRIRLVVDAARTKVDLYITNLTAGTAEVLDTTYTGSLPATTVFLGVTAIIDKSAGINSRQFIHDGWQYDIRLTNQR